LTIVGAPVSSRDMVGAYRNVNGSRDLTTPILETLCHRWASTCYGQTICLFWRLCLHPSDKDKIGCFGV